MFEVKGKELLTMIDTQEAVEVDGGERSFLQVRCGLHSSFCLLLSPLSNMFLGCVTVKPCKVDKDLVL